ncbi:MAG TPA: proline--tRNA ligase [Microthrixaceae bacterium]|nr:proline--tRNA ligase [Microthrixaceae bacterium]
MRWSKLFIPTLKETPGDAEAISHKLLIRAGFVRQLHAGHYSLLPLGLRSHNKVAAIIREEMDAIGDQEFSLPAMHPAALWQESGRWETMGAEMFRLEDRRGNELALGMTHEEVFTTLAREITSYRDLPQSWYQVQTKFRDEPRPKAGLLRVREFFMKDAYSFDLDTAGLDASFEAHRGAYQRIFDRLGLPAFPVMASSGAMGGGQSLEFMVPSAAGEDDVIICPNCDYRANVERATSALKEIGPKDGPDEVERFETPGVVTIEQLAKFAGGAGAVHQIKTLVYVIDGEAVVVILRGDHNLNEQKLADLTGGIGIRPAGEDEILALLGAKPGSLGAVGVTGPRIYADLALQGRTRMTTGANDDGWHLRGVDLARDISVSEWADLRTVTKGEPCIECGAKLTVERCVETGHIFKLGTKYSDAMGATVLDPNGDLVPLIMGCYGIGVGRALAVAIETHNDDKGMVLPVTVAPFEVCITIVKVDDPESVRSAETIYNELRNLGIDVILDDRDERPGVKFADSELVGIPFRITVGPKALAAGNVEFTVRDGRTSSEVPLGEVVSHTTELVHAGRRLGMG